MWWMTMMASAVMTVALGMWGCQYRELQPVFFGGGRILGSGSTPAAAANSQVAAEEGHAGLGAEGDDDAFSRGRGRGRGKDGAGEYEMVGMKQAQD
jgi:hypothetical protein